jgi:hypothetical protein
VAAGIVLAPACSSSADGNGPPPIADSVLALVPVASGLSFPVFLTAPPGDTARLFVLEKDGVIRIVRHDSVLTTPFLNITGLTTKSNEQGLLGLAFPPDYATSGSFYIYYTAPGGGGAGQSIIARYQVSADPDVAVPTGTVILHADQPFDNHNGGMIAFGPDSLLYIGFGDGGSAGDPNGTGQDRTDLLGSMLRIDVRDSSYSIPPSNPYANHGSFRHELWNYGLRNPWRFSFDRLTGDLYIGDVGQNALEEVDLQLAGSGGGENYGWSIMEARSCYARASCNRSGLTLPVVQYDHGQGCSVTGGYVYRGAAVPAVQGLYFYSDYCSGFLRSFRKSGGGATEQHEWPTLQLGGGVTSFGEDGVGNLYVVTSGGEIFRFAAP